MKVLLISPNTLTAPYPVYPIGLDYVAGAVSPEHEVRITDLNVVSRDELAAVISEFAPDIIGISCRNIDNTDAGDPLYFVSEYRDLVTWIRMRSDAVIVCGGSGFTIMPERIFQELGADYGVIGEGERFRLLVDALQNGAKADRIPGVVSSSAEARRPEPWNGEQARQFDIRAQHLEFYLKRGGMLSLQTRRGCSFACIYCPYPHIEGRKLRLNPPEEIARTALKLQEAGARYFFITDSAFNVDVAHSMSVAKAFREAGVVIPWGAFFAPIRVPEDYFIVMADAGLKHVEFGTESMSAAMLKTYRKPFSVEDVFRVHRQARDAGLHTAHYFLIGGPGESEATIAESLDNLEQLERTVFFFFVGIRIYPGTTLHAMALEEGKIDASTDLLQPVYYETDAIDRAAMEALIAKRAEGRLNWIFGSGGDVSSATIAKLHARGYVGPLWEHLVR